MKSNNLLLKREPYIRRHGETSFCLFLIGVAFVLRIWHLGTIPAGFFCDEASIGYNAYTLTTTGKDEHGKSFPIFFESFGDYRPPLPFYAAVPFVAVFGLTEWSVRLASAVIGTLTVFVMYLFLKNLLWATDQKQYAGLTGLIGAGMLAISPWHIHFSRFGTENIYLPLFILCAAWCFVRSIQKPWYFIPGAFFSIGACYTYLPGVILGPEFFLCSVCILLPYMKKLWRHALIGICIAGILFLPVIRAWHDGTLRTRWNNVGIEEQQTLSSSIHEFVTRYTAHFSPTFLITKGDVGYPGHFITRFGTHNQGQIYALDAILAFLGVIWCLVTCWKHPVIFFPLLFLIFYPIGGSVTGTDGGGPLAFRSILGSIAFPSLSAIGFVHMLAFVKEKRIQKLLVILVIIGYDICLSRYLFLYYITNPQTSQNFWGWQYGPRDIMQYFLTNKETYDEMYFPGVFNGGEIFIKFYDPTNLCEDKCRIGTPEEQFDPTKRQLFTVQIKDDKETRDILDRMSIQKTLFYPDGSPAYSIGIITSLYKPAIE